MNAPHNKTNAAPRTSQAAMKSWVIYGFDRVTVWLDHPELPLAVINLLRAHCTQVVVSFEQMPHNARWKLKVEIYQPTVECLIRLADALGTNIAASVTYVEIARDIPARSRSRARQWRNSLLQSARMKSLQQPVLRKKTTWYYGRRSDGKKRRSKVLVVYADRPSKLNNARPPAGTQPDLHTEVRCTGSAVLADLGIVTLDDLIHFDHQQFWHEHLRLYRLPKPTDLGRLLAKIAGTDPHVSGSALRNRSAKWRKEHSKVGIFIMHNALRSTPQLAKYLRKMSFPEWLQETVLE